MTDREILLHLKRAFTESEAVKALSDALARAEFKNGVLGAEVAELKYQLSIEKANVAAAVKTIDTLRAQKVPKEKIIDDRLEAMNKKNQKLNTTNQRLQKDVSLWQNKYFNLLNSKHGQKSTN